MDFTANESTSSANNSSSLISGSALYGVAIGSVYASDTFLSKLTSSRKSRGESRLCVGRVGISVVLNDYYTTPQRSVRASSCPIWLKKKAYLRGTPSNGISQLGAYPGSPAIDSFDRLNKGFEAPKGGRRSANRFG